jgi:hypothetical protein
LYGAFVWARRALNSQKRRFPARGRQDLDAPRSIGYKLIVLAALRAICEKTAELASHLAPNSAGVPLAPGEYVIA